MTGRGNAPRAVRILTPGPRTASAKPFSDGVAVMVGHAMVVDGGRTT
jgi:hypothetical protein